MAADPHPPEEVPAEPSAGRPAEPATAGPRTAAPPTAPQVPTSPDLVADSVISKPLLERMREAGPEEYLGVMVELSAAYDGGVTAAADRVEGLVSELGPRTVHRSGPYLTTSLRPDEVRLLAQADRRTLDPGSALDATAGTARAPRGAVHRMWPNWQTTALITRSVITTKCDAAQRAFNATGRDVVWAVMDSGIEASHRHFAQHANLDPASDLHRSFVSDAPGDALVDENGHGTHVAGIIAGAQVSDAPLLAATWYKDEDERTQSRAAAFLTVTGMAPRTTLVSLKVLRPDRTGDVRAMVDALRHVQEVNDHGRTLRIHGVNISVGYPFDPGWFATGLTPVCREVDRLVKSGVVVVIAAGNTGYGVGVDDRGRSSRIGFAMTIQDPGNTESAITVGATSSSPYLTGVSFFSSKGPTGDGRMKPDLVAPGERIISAAAGLNARKAEERVAGATYIEDSGTSMAAPHVSGAAAAFLSVHREFLGRPEEVKRHLLASASDLGRARHFQGAGLVDTMRAIQSV